MTDHNPTPPEYTDPPELPRDVLPFDPAHAACDESDEPDTDVELAEEDEPGAGEDDGPGTATQLSGADT